MERLNDAVSWYQNKIGAYDKQLWERSVEQKVLQSIHNVPKKTTKVKHELIDLDLVRGSTFPKAKPQHSWFTVSRAGIFHVVFMPLYFEWWKKSTCMSMTGFLLFFYVCQIATMIVYVTDSMNQVSAEDLSLAHFITPLIMVSIVGLVHAHVVSTQQSARQRTRTSLSHSRSRERSRKSNNRRKKHCQDSSGGKTTSERESGSHDTGIETNPEDIDPRLGPVGGRKSRAYTRRRTNSSGVKIQGRGELTSSVNGGCNVRLPPTDADIESDAEDSPDSTSAALPSSSLLLTKSSQPATDIQRAEKGYENLEYKASADCEGVCSNTQESRHLLEQPVECDVTGALVAPTSNGFILSDSLHVQCDPMVPHINQPVIRPATATPQTDVNPAPNPQSDIATLSTTEHIVSETESKDAVDNVQSSSAVYTNYSGQQEVFLHHEPAPGAEVGEILDVTNGVSKTKKANIPPKLSLDSTSLTGHQERSSEGYPRRARSYNTRSRKSKDSIGVSTCESDGEGSPDTVASPKYSSSSLSGLPRQSRLFELQTSEMEWEQDTLNTDMSSCSVSSTSGASSNSDGEGDVAKEEGSTTSVTHVASIMNNLASSTDKVSCMIWEGDEVKKAELTVLDVGWSIIQRVDRIPEVADYLKLGVVCSVVLFIMPCGFRLYHSQEQLLGLINSWSGLSGVCQVLQLLVGNNWRQVVIVVNGMVQRIFLSLIFFFLLSVVEKTFKQRLLYAKHFCYLTSSRRAKKYELPHFRLNKVRNIKTWLSLRSYLKKRGPQRSVDSIVSAAFILAVLLVSVMCIQLLQDYGSFLDHLGNWDLLIWSMALGLYLLRFMTLGTKINKKYRNFAVLITEQINLYLHMEQKPYKKDELMLANNVLKLAEDLLKELESPFKISGMSANPFLYNITKVIILSAFSAVLTELLGFKLKLYKIKIRT